MIVDALEELQPNTSEPVRRIYEVCEALAIRRIMRRIMAS